MVSFPNCKINIGLYVTGKRADGFHNIETIFFPIPIKDALEIIEDPEKQDISFTSSGLAIEGPSSNNLCMKAYALLKKDFPSLPGIKMHLHKNIPMGAGLGGGSADGTFALKLLNEKFDLRIDSESLKHYALQLGSDCPFFILNKPCLATGRGEILEPLNIDLHHYRILVVNPGIHINTGWAFSSLKKLSSTVNLKQLIESPVNTWKDRISNDFESAACEKYPEIPAIKKNLYAAGAVYAAMTGTGSTVYGIFSNDQEVDIKFPASYFQKWT